MRYPLATLVFLLSIAAWLFNVRPFSVVAVGSAVALAIVVLVMAWEGATRRAAVTDRDRLLLAAHGIIGHAKNASPDKTEWSLVAQEWMDRYTETTTPDERMRIRRAIVNSVDGWMQLMDRLAPIPPESAVDRFGRGASSSMGQGSGPSDPNDVPVT